MPNLTRRQCIRGAFAAAVALTQVPTWLFAVDDEGEPIPFLDADELKPRNAAINWSELRDWLTPTPSIYHVSHYGVAQLKAEDWKLQLTGIFDKARAFTLDEIKSLPRKEATVTLECGGNGMGSTFCGAIANSRWAGTPLAPILKESGLSPDAVEVAFWGADTGKEKIRDNEVTQHFARALSIKNALRDDLLLCYELNGEPLTQGHGFPLRLIVPGWYGIAWVKWLTHIEARDRALMTRFMAKDYVTLRGEQRGNETIWKETSVGPMNIKSMTARAVRLKNGNIRIYGAAWSDGTPIKSVELKIDDQPWTAADLQEQKVPHTWTFWSCDWKNPTPGEHTLVSRATDAKNRVQPAAEDPAIKLKKTYWEANQQWPRRIRV